MTKNTMKSLGVILRGIALLFLLIAFFCLLIEGGVTIEEEMWGIKISNNQRLDLDSEFSYDTENFFGRMSRLKNIGFDTTLEMLVCIALMLSFVYTIVSLFVPLIRKIYFCAIPLLLVILIIAVMIDNDTWYVFNHNFLGTSYGYRVYSQLSIKFNLSLFPSLIFAFLSFCLVLAIALIEMLSKNKIVEEVDAATDTETNEDGEYVSAEAKKQDEDNYMSLGTHICLLLFTFGIWQLIWIHKTTGYTNLLENEEKRNPLTKLLLCMFVPFYMIFWTYKTAQRIDQIAKARGIASDLTTICLILAFFVPIIAPILMQNKINDLVTHTAKGGTSESSGAESSEERNKDVENLKQLKELLDAGILTQEEFEAKKKQLLNL